MNWERTRMADCSGNPRQLVGGQLAWRSQLPPRSSARENSFTECRRHRPVHALGWPIQNVFEEPIRGCSPSCRLRRRWAIAVMESRAFLWRSVDSATMATGQPSSIMAQRRRRPSGVSGALRCRVSPPGFVGVSTAPRCLEGLPHQRLFRVNKVHRENSYLTKVERKGDGYSDSEARCLNIWCVRIRVEKRTVP